MQVDIKLILLIALIIIFAYGSHLVILLSFYYICDSKFTLISYFIPLIIFGSFGILILLFRKINCCKIIYRIIYIFFGIYLGIMIQMFFVSCIILIINAFIKIPMWVGLLVLISIPLIICIIGAICQFKTKIEFINLKYKEGGNNTKKICHLSDIHLGAIYQENFIKKIVGKILEIKPDVVVITGDLTDGSMKIKKEWLMPFNILSVPILYIAGNHELIYGKSEILNYINETNIQYIGNQIYNFDDCINFIGVDYEYNLKNKLLEFKEKIDNDGKINILLNHVPELKPKELEQFNIFLMLAGHTHGGQIFPFNIGAFFANKCFSGLYSYNNNHVYVSSGVGGYLIPMRIMSMSKIGVISIKY